MIVLHRKTLDGAEMASLPDLSMQNGRRETHYPMKKWSDFKGTAESFRVL